MSPSARLLAVARSAYRIEVRDVPGYEGLYQVSDHGHVYSLPKNWMTSGGAKSHSGMWLKLLIDRGYATVRLRRDGRDRHCMVHRLVASAFVPNPSGKRDVNHIDGDRLNNFVWNLAWCSTAENNADAQRRGHGRGRWITVPRIKPAANGGA